MRSFVHERSYGSVKVYWLDLEALIEALRAIAARLASFHPEIARVVLFGSVADCTATPPSDADLLLVVRGAKEPWHQRLAPYQAHFADLAFPVDLFVYAPEEVNRLPLARRAAEEGLDLVAAR